jgi:dienelactone hydrolase
MYTTLVVDLRRALDVLLERPDVDAKRVGYVGHSLGAAWGSALAGFERRIKAFVLIGGSSHPGRISGEDWNSKIMQSVVGDSRLRFNTTKM